MRALRIHAYGGAEVMRLEEVAVPIPSPGELLVKVHAASINPVDWKMREGLMQMPLPRILGRDAAGIEEATGRRLMGIGRDGTHAEYAVFPAGSFAAIPPQVSFEEAACLGIAGLSAWIALAENARVGAGQRVLVHAGAGGVGSLAIQIARLRGAEVWTTCSARNSEWCLALGAHRIINYVREDFAALGPTFDAVLDTIGGDVHRRSAMVLKAGGALAYLNAAPREPAGRQDIRLLPTDVRPTPARLDALLNAGLRVPVEARFPLARIVEAYELSRGGHARGKIVIQT